MKIIVHVGHKDGLRPTVVEEQVESRVRAESTVSDPVVDVGVDEPGGAEWQIVEAGTER